MPGSAPPRPAMPGSAVAGLGLSVLALTGPSGSPATLVLTLALVATMLLPEPGPLARLGLAAALAAALAAEVALPAASADVAEVGLALLPGVALLVSAAVFARSLRRGEEPLILHYIRHDPRRDPAECAGYARGLTLFWAVALTLAALAEAGPVLAGGTDLGLIPSAVLLVLFLGEHAVRSLRFPAGGIAWPTHTLAAILRAERARHG